MGLTCECVDYCDDGGWWYYGPSDYKTAPLGRRRRCCSCKKLIECGSDMTEFLRERSTRDDIEENIHGCERTLASWYMCETCSDIYFNLAELGFCIYLGRESMPDLLREYQRLYAPGQRCTELNTTPPADPSTDEPDRDPGA